LDIQRHAPTVSHDFDLHVVAHIFTVEHTVEVVLLADCLPVNLRDDVAEGDSIISAADSDCFGGSHSGFSGPRPGNDPEHHHSLAYRQIESLDQPRSESTEWNRWLDAQLWFTQAARRLDIFDNLPRGFDLSAETGADRAA